jgi:hypothetical protein
MRLLIMLFLTALTVSSLGLWRRSHTIADRFVICRPDSKMQISFGQGRMMVTYSDGPPLVQEPNRHSTQELEWWPVDKLEPPRAWQTPGTRVQFLGITKVKYVTPFEASVIHHRIIIRMWWSLVFAVPLTFLVVRQVLDWRRRRSWRIVGRCECGYDLTGNKSGTCPECGRVREHAKTSNSTSGKVSPGTGEL